jgi:hypothetical protein
MSATHSHQGSCHCGAIRVTLSFTTPPDATEVRSCQCGFCARQGARTISDPAGHAIIEIDDAVVRRYQFGTKTATSLVCGRCGTYAGAYVEADGKTWSIANARGLAIAQFAHREGKPMVYEQETAYQRTARRKVRWTPTEIVLRV